MKEMYVVLIVRPWSQLNFTSNHPLVAAMVESAITKAPIPGSTGFMPAFETREAAEEFADGGAEILVLRLQEVEV